MKIEIQKASNTYADTLHAVGMASLLSELTGKQARICEHGASFTVSCDDGIQPENWLPPSPGFLFVWRRSKDGARPLGETLDYEQQKQIAETLKKSKATKGAKRSVAQAVQVESNQILVELHPEYRMCATMQSVKGTWNSDRTLFRWLTDEPKKALELAKSHLLKSKSKSGIKFANGQLLNPCSGKGTHASKSVASGPREIAHVLTEPFVEWMKLRGLYRALLAYRVNDGIKCFVIEPGEISEEHVAILRSELRALELWGNITLDIQSVLRLTAILVEHSKANNGEIDLYNDSPDRVIRGFRQSYFKSFGKVVALMNDSFLPVPDWFPVKTENDVQAYLQIVREPFGDRINVRSGPMSTLREDRSDDIPILQSYRRWLTSGLVKDFLEMHCQFAVHLMQQYGANEFAKPFSVEILDLLLQRLRRNSNVKDIVTRDGFRNLARAIRNTTIYAVSMSSSKREVRFGLAQKWKQQIKAGDAHFVATLSEFVQSQNWEVEHKLAGKAYVVTENDLNDVVELIETHGAELVGMLLLAYGFARAESTQPKTIEQTS